MRLLSRDEALAVFIAGIGGILICIHATRYIGVGCIVFALIVGHWGKKLPPAV